MCGEVKTMPKCCSTRGCPRPAAWEIEVRQAGADSALYYACDEHCQEWGEVLSPQDEVKTYGEIPKETR
jgi:hypothetical protein